MRPDVLVYAFSLIVLFLRTLLVVYGHRFLQFLAISSTGLVLVTTSLVG